MPKHSVGPIVRSELSDLQNQTFSFVICDSNGGPVLVLKFEEEATAESARTQVEAIVRNAKMVKQLVY